MTQIHDIYHEPHHSQYQPPSVPTNNSHNINNPNIILNRNYKWHHIKCGSRSDMGKIQCDKMDTRGKNDD